MEIKKTSKSRFPISFKGNIYVSLFLRLFVVLVLFFLSRIGFYLFNISYFPDISLERLLKIFAGGLLFDISAILYTNSLIILLHILPFKFRYSAIYQKIIKYLFLFFNSIALTANCGDFVYYRFTLRRTTSTVFTEFSGEKNLFGIFTEAFVQYWQVSLFWIFLLACLYFFYKKIHVSDNQQFKSATFYPSAIFFMILIFGLTIAGMRGGFWERFKPLRVNEAGRFVETSKEISLVLNTPFSIFNTLQKKPLERIEYFSQQELETIYSPIHYADTTGTFNNKNVVVFILESFSTEHFGTFNNESQNSDYKGYTPFLDSLIQYSNVYWFSFANGRKSVEATPAILASLPSFSQPFVHLPYSVNEMEGIGNLLYKKGYHTSFFHGADNGSMGFQEFVEVAGIKHYFGRNQYNNDADYDGIWGIWDEEFLQYQFRKLNEFPQPFFSAIFTVSSHHPFNIPQKYEAKFEEAKIPLQKCISYTDNALRLFFEKAKNTDWFKNTIFVFTADHASDAYLKEYKTITGFFKVPVFFYLPEENNFKMNFQIAQQIDIMPTILGYLNYDEDYFAYGQNLLDTTVIPFAINYLDNNFQFFEGDYLLLFNNDSAFAMYNFKEDIFLKKNLLGTLPEMETKMEKRLKAFIQQYNNRLIDNKMTSKK